MRDPERIDKVLDLVRRIWHKYPDTRLSQMIINCVEDGNYSGLYNLEDEQLVERLKKIYGV
jgi:uncharacterized protein YihD (DUF1040 family)